MIARDLKACREENTELHTSTDKLLLYVKTIIKKYIMDFSKDYSEHTSKTNESYMKAFRDIKSSLVVLGKIIQMKHRDQIATTLTKIQQNIEKLMDLVVDVVRWITIIAP